MPGGWRRATVGSQYRFLKAVASEGQSAPSFAEALHVQEVMEAALLSSAEKRWVNIRDLRSQGRVAFRPEGTALCQNRSLLIPLRCGVGLC